MSVSDPLIKDLKGWTRKIIEYNGTIEDSNLHLIAFCVSLEKCFQQGLVRQTNSLGITKNMDAWQWMLEICRTHEISLPTFKSAIDLVSSNPRVQTDCGKLRLLIRICLVKKCLHMPVELIVRRLRRSIGNEYYIPNSILGDEILGEIFLSVLLQISRLTFNLNINNASFLDESWQLPLLSSVELVPCKSLGITVYFISRKALIVNVEENSIAGEDDKVQVGDVLDAINDSVLTGGSAGTKGTLAKIMRRYHGLPITLHIIKYRTSDDLYGPIVNLFCLSEIPRLMSLMPEKRTENKIVKKLPELERQRDNTISPGYKVLYCGCITTGTEGDVKQIEQAIWRILRSGNLQNIPVRFECLELGIKVTHDIDNAVILEKNYMEISSCGRTINIPDYFAFIAGNNICNLSTTFDAHVFYHKNESETQTILQSLGQGFHRTHFAV